MDHLDEHTVWEERLLEIEDCQAAGCDDADLSMVFFLKSGWESKKHHSDGSVRPPKHLTKGKHSYRIRKWVK